MITDFSPLSIVDFGNKSQNAITSEILATRYSLWFTSVFIYLKSMCDTLKSCLYGFQITYVHRNSARLPQILDHIPTSKLLGLKVERTLQNFTHIISIWAFYLPKLKILVKSLMYRHQIEGGYFLFEQKLKKKWISETTSEKTKQNIANTYNMKCTIYLCRYCVIEGLFLSKAMLWGKALYEIRLSLYSVIYLNVSIDLRSLNQL